MNSREKGEVDRMKEKLREIAERRIENKKEIQGWLEAKVYTL